MNSFRKDNLNINKHITRNNMPCQWLSAKLPNQSLFLDKQVDQIYSREGPPDWALCQSVKSDDSITFPGWSISITQGQFNSSLSQMKLEGDGI